MKRGFTLIEVLVAGGVLFIVSSAVVGLSNSIIQGTGRNADRTVTNRWASEGLELTSKIRTDRLKNVGTSEAADRDVWFAPAADASQYGWYKLTEQTIGGVTSWSLDKLSAVLPHLALNLVSNPDIPPLGSQGLVAYRLICIEAYGAFDRSDDPDFINCNRDEAGVLVSDGVRSNVSWPCDPKDAYCLASRSSINQNQTDPQKRIIPPGNVVKVRSIIVWQDRTSFQTTELATVLTNWKGTEQD